MRGRARSGFVRSISSRMTGRASGRSVATRIPPSLGLATAMPTTNTWRPMLASLAEAPLDDPQLVYEPKYDGIRAIAEILPGAARPVRLWSRLGNEKTGEFPAIAA